MRGFSLTGRLIAMLITWATFASLVGCSQYDENYTPPYKIVTMTFEEDDTTDLHDRLLQDGVPVSVVESESEGCFLSDNFVGLNADRITEFNFTPDASGNAAYVYEQLYVRTNCQSILFEGVDTFDVTRVLTFDTDTFANYWIRVDMSVLSQTSGKGYVPLKSLKITPVAGTDVDEPVLYFDNISVRTSK